VESVQAQLVRQVRADGLHPDDISLPPVRPTQFSVSAIDTQYSGKHVFKKFRADFALELDILYYGADAPAGFSKLKPDSAKVSIKRNGRTIARVDAAIQNLQNLNAIDFEDPADGAAELDIAKLNLDSVQRIALRDQVLKSLGGRGDLHEKSLKVFLEIPRTNGSGNVSIFVDESDRFSTGSKMLKHLHLKGLFSRGKGACLAALNKLMGK
jgi:hypothetical protein